MALTYPVDVNKTYVAVLKSDFSIIRQGFHWPRADGMPVVDLDPSIALGLVVQLPEPPYNPITQKLVPNKTIDKPSSELRLGYDVVDLTPEEVIETAETKAVIQGVADLKSGTGTQAERLIRCEKACAYLLKKLILT